MHRHVWPSVRFLATALLLACADDTGGAQFPVESGLDEKRMLQTLSPAEAQQLCRTGIRATDVFFDSASAASFLCTLTGAAGSLPAKTAKVEPASCEKMRMECLSKPVTRTHEGDLCSSYSIPSQCAVSVGEYERCAERYFEALLNEWKAVSCASLAMKASLEIPGELDDASEVPGCERLQSECPDGKWPSVTVTVRRMAQRP
jgi:hypothetical protein